MDIYLDHAASTPLHSEVLKTILEYHEISFANPESIHEAGQKAHLLLENARSTCAKILNCKPLEIIFTPSGTFANNLALLGYCRKHKTAAKNHLIISAIEHSSINETAKQLEKEGFEITTLQPDKQGLIAPKTLEQAITPKTLLISIIYGQNEIGTLQDIAALAKIANKHDIPFHSDACQCANTENLDIQKLGLQLLTLNASKTYGPKGAGLLFKQANIELQPITFGGHQENGLVPGTHNMSGIIGLTKALELAQSKAETERHRLIKLRDDFIHDLLHQIPKAQINGHHQKRLANNISLTIPHLNGLELLLKLNDEKIFISTGSACSASQNKPSSILTAIGLDRTQMLSTIRITLGHSTTTEMLKKVSNSITRIAREKEKNLFQQL